MRPVGVDSISAEMHKNSLAGSEKYKGKTLPILGFITENNKTSFGTPYVVLVGLTEDYRHLEVVKVTCYLRKDEARLNELETRTPILVSGTISKLEMSYGRANAEVEKCEILKLGMDALDD